jgi:cardiolipin synthase
MLLHTKIIGIDDDIAVLSSGNLDLRSLELDLRVRLVCYNRGVEADMQQLFADYLRHPRPLHLHEWRAAR